MVSIVKTLHKNHLKAINMMEHACEYYDNLTMQFGPIATAKWTTDIEEAEAG